MKKKKAKASNTKCVNEWATQWATESSISLRIYGTQWRICLSIVPSERQRRYLSTNSSLSLVKGLTKVPIACSCEKQWGLHLSETRVLEPRHSSSGAHAWTHPLKLTCSGLQCRGSGSKSTRDMWGGTELTSFRARGARVGTTLFGDGGAGRSHYSFVESFSHLASRHRWALNLSSPLIWLCLPCFSNSLRAWSTQLAYQAWAYFSDFSTQVACLGSWCKFS